MVVNFWQPKIIRLMLTRVDRARERQVSIMNAEIKLSPELTNALKAAITEAAESIAKESAEESKKWPDYLNKGQAAEYLGVSRNTFQQWITSKTVPYKKIGSIYRFSRSDLDKFMMSK